LSRFVIGLGKKVLIANVLAKVADDAFAAPVHSLSTYECWVGALAYTFQIYFDFSGYSDMAIGLGKIFGFRFPENFNNPYTSKSLTEFWRRWHISLGNWMKNYLYIPLGGNKVETKKRLYANLALVFVLSGFWHGANWTFLAWGIYYGAWLIAERVFLAKQLQKIGVLAHLFSFIIIVIGWVIFRSDTLEYSISYITNMFNDNESITNHIFLSNKIRLVLFIAIFFSFFTLLPYGKTIENYFFHTENKNIIAQFAILGLCMLIFTLSLMSITSSSFNPFIYFRF